MNKAITEFDARVKVNEFLPEFFQVENKEDFLKSFEENPRNDGVRVLNLIQNHISAVGSMPLVAINSNDLRSSKEKSLMIQLKDDVFLHKFGGVIDLKLDNNDNMLLKVLNKNNMPLCIMSTEITSEKTYLDDQEVTFKDVDIYNARFREDGKKLNQSNSEFGNIMENLFSEQYHNISDNNETVLTDDGFDAVPVDRLNAQSIMDKISHDNTLSDLFSKAVQSANNFDFILSAKESNSVPDMSL